MWERINVEFDKIREISKAKQRDQQSGHIIIPQDILWSVVREIDYFAYLILVGEIKDKHVLGYYKIPFSQYIESILNHYTSADQRYYLYLDYGYFRELIKKWDISRPEEMPQI